jgi:hypothetical protein
MLNEIKEFKEYTSELKISEIDLNSYTRNYSIYGRIRFKGNSKKKPIKFDISNDTETYRFPGIERILTIIARGYYFHNINKDLEILKNDVTHKVRIKTTEEALRGFLSLDIDDNSMNYSYLNNKYNNLVDKDGKGLLLKYLHSIKNFYEKLIKNKTLSNDEQNSANSEIKKLYATIEGLNLEIKSLLIDPFAKQNKFYTNKNYNQIYLKTIIAKAINKGPLKNKIVYINKNDFKRFLNVNLKTNKLSAKHYMLFALFFYYLANNESFKYVAINNFDFVNWLNTSKFSDEVILFQKLNTLGLEYKLINNTRKLIRFNKELLSEINFYISYDSHSSTKNEDYYVFKDEGLLSDEKKKEVLNSLKALLL